MVKVVALSKYGFKVDSLKNEWEKVDKSLLKKEIFNILDKGMEIEIKERNHKGFILDFKILNHKDQGLERESITQPSFNVDRLSKFSNDSLSLDVKNQELYQQCVSLAFNHITSNECGLNLPDAFDLADDIYKEYLKRLK